MQWEGREGSENFQDLRGMKPAAGLAVGGGGIIILLLGYFLGIDPAKLRNLVGGMQGGNPQQQGKVEPINDRHSKFFSVVLKMTEDVWNPIFRQNGKTYEEPKMRIFTEAVPTGCGRAPSAVGPFYCPADKTLYLDPSFFVELETKLKGSAADFSQAYVVAHEVGHHVQNLLGYSREVDRMRGTPRENEFSVRLELQADYLAGVWAHHAQKQMNILQGGDIESAIKSANAIGDDKLQKNAKGYVSPEGFTHGTAAQRVQSFKMGLADGDLKKLDIFFKAGFRNGQVDLP